MTSITTITLPQTEDVADQYLSRKEASRYLRDTFGNAAAVAPSTLAKLATLGGGPEFRRFGRRVGYTRQALDTFVKDRASNSMTSTSTPDYRMENSTTVSIRMSSVGGVDEQLS